MSRGPSVPIWIRLVLVKAWDRARARLSLWLRSLLVLPVVACTQPRTAEDVQTTATVAYALACDALAVADAVTVDWLDSLESPTTAELATGARVVEALEDARAALVVAHDALEAGEDALPRVREAVGLLRDLSPVLPGRSLPVALEAAEAVLGGAS